LNSDDTSLEPSHLRKVGTSSDLNITERVPKGSEDFTPVRSS